MIRVFWNDFKNELDCYEAKKEYEAYLFFEVLVIIECKKETTKQVFQEFYETLTSFEKCIIGTLAKQMGFTTHIYYRYQDYLYLYKGLSIERAKEMCRQVGVAYKESVEFSQYFEDCMGMLQEKIQLRIIEDWEKDQLERIPFSFETKEETDYREYVTHQMFREAFSEEIAITFTIDRIFYDKKYQERKEKWICFLEEEMKEIKRKMKQYPKIADTMPGMMSIRETKASSFVNWNVRKRKEIEESRKKETNTEEVTGMIAIYKRIAWEKEKYEKLFAITKEGVLYEITETLGNRKTEKEKKESILKGTCYGKKVKENIKIKEFRKVQQKFSNFYKKEERNPFSYTKLEECYAVNPKSIDFVFAKWENGVEYNTRNALPFLKLFSEVMKDVE